MPGIYEHDQNRKTLGGVLDIVAYDIPRVARISRHRSQCPPQSLSTMISAGYRLDFIERKQTKVMYVFRFRSFIGVKRNDRV